MLLVICVYTIITVHNNNKLPESTTFVCRTTKVPLSWSTLQACHALVISLYPVHTIPDRFLCRQENISDISVNKLDVKRHKLAQTVHNGSTDLCSYFENCRQYLHLFTSGTIPIPSIQQLKRHEKLSVTKYTSFNILIFKIQYTVFV